MYDSVNTNALSEDHISASRCRALFCEVIKREWDMVFGGNKSKDKAILYHHSLNSKRSRAWFGSRDFAEVCTCAGVDPEYVFDKFKAKLTAEGMA